MKFDFNNLQFYSLLVKIAQKHAVDPSSSIEAEAFFRELLLSYPDALEKPQLEIWLDERISENFVCINERPGWIQGAEWPFHDGHPMVFIGQIDIAINDSETAKHIFHDDTAYYLFASGNGQTSIVCQQF